jgi:hypothetical protein
MQSLCKRKRKKKYRIQNHGLAGGGHSPNVNHNQALPTPCRSHIPRCSMGVGLYLSAQRRVEAKLAPAGGWRPRLRGLDGVRCLGSWGVGCACLWWLVPPVATLLPPRVGPILSAVSTVLYYILCRTR